MHNFRQRILAASSTLYITYFCIILVFTGMIGFIVTDIYVPSLPFIARHFSATAGSVKLTITLFYLTYALGQLFYGPIVDSFGRKGILIGAMLLGLVGSIICAVAPDLWVLYLGRLIQGFGYAADGVALLAMARDILSMDQFVQIGSIVATAFELGPMIAPALGAYIEYAYGWRMTFTMISVYSVFVVAAIMLLLPETLPKQQRVQFQMLPILRTYGQIFKNKFFIGNTLANAVSLTGVVVFFTISSFMLQNHLAISVLEYGWISVGLMGCVVLSKIANSFLLLYINVNKLIYAAVILLAFSSGLLLVLALLGYFSLAAILSPFALFAIASGVLFSNALTVAFKPFKSGAGSVSGLIGFISFIAVFVGAAVASELSDDRLLPLAVLMSIISFGLLISYYFLVVRSPYFKD